MDFSEFAIKTRWWFLGGFFCINILFSMYLENLAIIGLAMLVFSIIGFVKNRSYSGKKKYGLPEGFDYPEKSKKEEFVECPVCKKGKIKQDSENEKLFVCKKCQAQFKQKGDMDYILSVKNCEEEYKKFEYKNIRFSIYEWNTIAITGKTLRENTLEQFRKGIIPKSTNSSIPLKTNEFFVWAEQSQLHEPRAVRNYGGTSVRVAKGVSVRVGQAESHQEMRHIDSGTLSLTSKRIIFSGGQRSSNIDLKKILNITRYKDGVKINIENRQKPQFFTTKDSEFWQALISGAMISH